MRELLFKGKRIDNDEWVEGFYLPIGKRAYIICEAETECTDGENSVLYATEWYGIDPKTVCQYTGLTDKNGRKIFEGDIVMYYVVPAGASVFPDRLLRRVEYYPSMCGFVLATASGTLDSFEVDFNDFSEFEVFGNIFENPELIDRMERATE